MQQKTPKGDVGILIGRFQVNSLHQAHKDLIQSVCDRHPKVIIFLGLSPCLVTRNNPLDFESRKQMILSEFPHVNVLYIKDVPSDEDWSNKLDNQISDLISPNQSPILYGARDSFLDHYKGKFETCELESDVIISGTQIRNEISKRVKASPEFRAGVIWGAYNQYPKVFATVDVAIFDEEMKKILLGKKPGEDKYRFIGGFSTPSSHSFEEDAMREVREETGLEVSNVKYVGSCYIDDWRYKNEVDKIKTLVFKTTYIFGAPKAADDIEALKWFDLQRLTFDDIMPAHHVIFELLVKEGVIKYER